jgi:superfamily I DNA and/or RNA helicase
VAITRAKNFLFVLGNELTLRNNKNWNALVNHAHLNEGRLNLTSKEQSKNLV